MVVGLIKLEVMYKTTIQNSYLLLGRKIYTLHTTRHNVTDNYEHKIMTGRN